MKDKLTDLFSQSLSRFVQMQSAAGVVLLIATVAAMLVKNSPVSELYVDFLNLDGQIRLGNIDINKPLFLWVNDLWMAIFFFTVGLEIKNEVLYGSLRDRGQVILPLLGAVGGVAAPVAVFLLITWSSPESIRGWAIPTTTDIAFSLAVLSLLSTRTPPSLKMFLMTLAIIDDLIAIVLIAMFYTTGLSGISVFAGTVVLLLMLLLRCLGVRHLVPYILLGVVLWTCVLKSGIHATLAGVATAFVIPGEKRERSESNLADIIHGLHPWVAFMILPSFAFVNAGIDFEDLDPARLVQPLPMGIFFGLFLGKMLGVFSVSAVAIKLKFASLPSNCNWGQLFGVSILCGIGFTMSLFIGGLAFSETGVGYARPDRLAIILASCASAILGYLVLSASSPGRNPQV